MRAKNQMSWRGNRPRQPKPVQRIANKHYPLSAPTGGVSDIQQRQSAPAFERFKDTEGQPTKH